MKIISEYNLCDIDYLFINFIDEYINKYPFKSYNIMNVFYKKNVVYIKDTTMIIDLIKINNHDVINIFSFFKEMLRNNLLNKVIYKKLVLIIYFKDEFITSFFKIKNKWLIIPLIKTLLDKKTVIHFDSYVLDESIDTYLCLVELNNFYISIDTSIKKKLNDNHIPLVINFYNNLNENLLFSFNKDVFIENLYDKLKVN